LFPRILSRCALPTAISPYLFFHRTTSSSLTLCSRASSAIFRLGFVSFRNPYDLLLAEIALSSWPPSSVTIAAPSQRCPSKRSSRFLFHFNHLHRQHPGGTVTEWHQLCRQVPPHPSGDGQGHAKVPLGVAGFPQGKRISLAPRWGDSLRSNRLGCNEWLPGRGERPQ